ncbi:MAG: MBOAT family protein [Lachnospiraceae bacterium]|nr:MBOAT family protein [Lachnospiraceae bacterium]
MAQGPAFALLLLASTVITWLGGLALGRCSVRSLNAKLTCGIVVLLNLSALIFFKYYNFICSTIGVEPALSVMLPIGISFYVFQVIGYMVDVYRGKIKPERSFFTYALFVSFFPQILAGPIGRAGELIPQFQTKADFDYARIRHGLFRMLWGFFMKLVISSRLAIVTDLIYGNYSSCTGYQLILGTFAYAFQIYCDFASYSTIAIGAAEVLGITLRENFRQPFFARSCKELWRRWHISLNSWFTDYLYIPLGGSRVSKFRKYLNVLIVFSCSGLWHGAAWTYVLWGFLSGLFQILGEILAPLRDLVQKPFKGNNKFTGKLHSAAQIVITFLLFCVALVFFKAPSIEAALDITHRIFLGFDISSIMSTNLFSLGLGTLNMLILCFSLMILLIYDLINEKTGDTASFILSKTAPARWSVYYLLSLMILLSANIGAAQFIYFNF